MFSAAPKCTIALAIVLGITALRDRTMPPLLKVNGNHRFLTQVHWG